MNSTPTIHDFLRALEDCLSSTALLLDRDPAPESAAPGAPEHAAVMTYVSSLLTLASLLEDLPAEAITAAGAEGRIDELQTRQILAEKNLLPVLGRTEEQRADLLSTFACYFLSAREGETPHSPLYMRRTRQLHQILAAFYGRDPRKAPGCTLPTSGRQRTVPGGKG